MVSILIQNLSEEEKKRLDIAKAKSDAGTWKELLLHWLERFEVEKNE